MIIFSPVGGWLADRSGRHVPAVAGTVLLALGALPLVLISDGWSWMLLLALLVLIVWGSGSPRPPSRRPRLNWCRATR